MNLILDIGNSAIKAGIFHDRQLLETKSFLLKEGLISWINDLKIQRIGIGSVGKALEVENWLQGKMRIFELHSKLELPFKNFYESPQTLGIDRIAAVIAAQKVFPAKNLLVIDFGTCITYDVVDEYNQYFGGAISPGQRMRFKAMSQFTSRLPEAQIIDYQEFIGRNTLACLASGVQIGILGEVHTFIAHAEQKFGEIQVVLTGGDASLFEKQINKSIFADPHLVLIGLNELLEFNFPNEI